MTFVSSLRITGKLAVLAGGLVIALVVLGGSAIMAVRGLLEDVEQVADQGEAATAAVQAGQAISQIRRLEFSMALDRSQDVSDVRRRIEGHIGEFRSAIHEAAQTPRRWPFLRKPFSRDDLMSTLLGALAGRETAQ